MRTVMKVGLIGGLFLMAMSLCVPASRADAMNQATKMTFNRPVRVPGRVLPAGTYWFMVLDGNTGQLNVTEIYNANHSKLLTTLETESTDKTGGYGEEATVDGIHWPTGKLVLTFAEGAKRQPLTLLDWYYPGNTDGHRFVYSNRREKQLNEEKHETMAVKVQG